MKEHQNIDSIREFIEKLSELEHDQWSHYSKAVSQRIMNAKSLEYLQRHINEQWAPNWKPYAMLSEEEKEKDRIWAHKVFDTMRSNPDLMRSILSKSTKIY
jgi:hypothetical protein